ncbi:MAG: aldo/keto reductase [Armatimonadetes bacterium]|nr:aldo/keto reductase [Armatimonadota bacterium]
MGKLAWGILSTGRISGVFAKAVAESSTGEVLAVGSRTQEAADRFGDEYNVPRRYGSYEALLADPDVQAVYISTPHPMHAEWAVKAAEAKKHILCEKPLTLNYPEAMAVIEAVRRHDVFLMEAFMYRCHPQITRLVELIREGAIGDVRIIQATFSFHAGFNPESRLFNNALGGGGILDVGCYTTSISRLIAGAAHGKPFEDPIEVKGVAHLGETGVDEWAVGIMQFPGDIIAQISTGVALNQENVVRIFGSEGNILIPAPWFGSKAGEPARIVVNRNGEQPKEVLVPNDASSYTHEADIVAKNIEKRQAPPPAMTWDDSLGNMKTLDMWRQAVGLVYDIEKPDANFPTIDHRPLTIRSDANMRYGSIPGLEKPVSRIAMGAVGGGGVSPLASCSILFDEFFRQGGNCFDTAYIYGGGNSERILGQWIRNRGIREQVVILDKGAHTPFCNPIDLTSQLFESLDRLGTDYVDIYMMHRDNPDIPVGEFIDVLNEHLHAGRIKVFGVSNWTIERIEAANEYARQKGLKGIAAVSNNFSLARMIEPPWAGCLASSDSQSRAWFVKTQMPLMAWSSLARGFFAYGHPRNHTDPEMIRCWHSEDNILRAERLLEMAEKKGVPPVSIALAYVLCQPFPTFALAGPANLEELRTLLAGLNVQLSPDELKWLNLEL